MNQLIIYAHPNPVSFCHGLMIAMRDTYLSSGNEVMVNDLYAINFDPVLSGSDFEKMNQGKYSRDVVIEHEKIAWADVVTFICPVWWQGVPAILKGYFDRVFTPDYAYKITENGVEGLLQDKRFLMVCTTGLSEMYYKKTGMRGAMAKTIGEGVFDFCSIPLAIQKFFYDVPAVGVAGRQKMLDTAREIARKFAQGEEIYPYF